MEYIDSSMDLVELKILLSAKSYLVFQLFIFKVNTFTRIYYIATYFAKVKYFSFAMVKNIILQFWFASCLNSTNNLNCFAEYSVSFMQFGLEHKLFEIIEESFNLKFENQMKSCINLDPFSLSLITTH